MQIADIKIERVIAHEVLKATSLEDRPPILSQETVGLDTAGKRLIGNRMVEKLSTGSHSIDVAVENSGPGSPFSTVVEMLDGSKQNFIAGSQNLALALTRAQTAGSIKEGVGVFLQGDCLHMGERKRFLTIVKADPDQGLYREPGVGKTIKLQYVSDLIFGQSQRLIKMAVFLEEIETQDTAPGERDPSEFSIRVYDHMMQNGGGGKVANYFFQTFLECKIAASAPVKTKRFFEETEKFINLMDVDPEVKKDLRSDLVSFMRDNRTIIEARTFAGEKLPRLLQDDFIEMCSRHNIDEAFAKDVQLIKGRMRRQTVRFSSDVTIAAKPEIMKESVRIGDEEKGWTTIRIKGKVNMKP